MSNDVQLSARGLLFDNDGVLVDSGAAVDRSWSRWARAQGLEPERVTGMVHGRRAADTVATLVAEAERERATAPCHRAKSCSGVSSAAECQSQSGSASQSAVRQGAPISFP